ncbi:MULTISPECIES: Panacea domain-containing protein [unclassified Bradyrhizobium]|uniref:Panacea domain-containing protein n=1 Tax=unclassified Bradyrhizobium TaxID=2631580 RepID=UPI0028E5E735|nr:MULTISPECIES: Panacea domain-containing protein [unclassified Bradyrhizobium]
MSKEERQYDPEMPTFLAPLVGFRSRKAAQLCALFAVKEGGTIEKLKLIKLVYLAERQCLADWHRPILFDELFSLPHGPICSSTLNGINGRIHEDIWDDFVARSGNQIVAMKKFERDSLDEISDAEIDIINNVWQRFGHMTASQLRNYTHDNCPEYTETDGRIPIAYRELLEAVGASSDDAEAIDREISELRREENALAG